LFRRSQRDETNLRPQEAVFPISRRFPETVSP
jgi:hypothetical protein